MCDRHAGRNGARALLWHDGQRGGETYTFRDLKRLSDRLAAGLAVLGLDAGARAALMLPQAPEHVVAHIAIFKLGAVGVPLSRLFGPDALRYRLGDSGARILLTDGENLGKIFEIWSELPGLRHVVLCDRQSHFVPVTSTGARRTGPGSEDSWSDFSARWLTGSRSWPRPGGSIPLAPSS